MRHNKKNLGAIKPLAKGGFTIIEVLIVLAIAGLILLIVFLAVPALQRNSRNTSYRSEAAQTAAAYREYMNDYNNGSITTTVTFCTTANCPTFPPINDAMRVWQLTKNTAITELDIRFPANATLPTLSRAIIRISSKCDQASGTYTSPAAPNQFAVLYGIEDSSGSVIVQCINS